MAHAIFFAWVSDGAGVDDVALARLHLEVLRWKLMHDAMRPDDEDAGDVRMSDEEKGAFAGLEIGEGLRFVGDVVECGRIRHVSMRGNCPFYPRKVR